MKSFRIALKRLLRWPAKIFNTRLRLSFCLAITVVSMTMMAQVFGLLPDPNHDEITARKLQTETLALTGSSMVESNGRLGIFQFEKAVSNTLERTEGLISIGLRRNNGSLDFAVGPHAKAWEVPENGRSNDQFMFVGIFNGGEQIGQLELCYKPVQTVTSILQYSSVQLSLFLFGGGFLLFNVLLHRTLSQLDPRGAVPQRVREAFDNMAEGLLILDRKSQIVLANQKFGDLVGKEIASLIGAHISEFEWAKEQEELPWTVAARDQIAVSSFALEIRDVSQKNRTFSVNAAPILGHDGKSCGVMVTFDDITVLEEHKRELVQARIEADEANQAKSNFLSRMSHEIRTPLNAIIGYTDILQEGGVKPNEQVRYLTTIQSSGEHLLTLINDILDLSKVEAGQLTIERRNIRVVPIVRRVFDTLIGKASEKGLDLKMEIDGKIPSHIETDETRLQQILINLVGNAIKFTSDGGITVIARHRREQNKDWMEFDISDTGIGMTQEALERIFDPFSQADVSVTRKFGGTGLGLAICKQLSESLGGEISVTSCEGAGSVFTFSIDPGQIPEDVVWVEKDSLESEMESLSVKQGSRNKKIRGHVLVVDDGKANRDLACLILKRLGMTSETAVNGQEAVDLVAEKQFDIVLMDVNMPVMDGVAATRKIRESKNDTPVVALTASTLKADQDECLAAGCNDFLAKPIRQELLIDVLAKFLEVEDLEASPQETRPAMGTPSTDVAQSHADFTDDIESSLAATLASLGFGDDELETIAPENMEETNELRLPQAVRTTFDDPDYLQIAADFAERLPGRMVEFDAAVDQCNSRQLCDLGHWLAGAAGSTGFDDFVRPARELEHCAERDFERAQVLVNHLKELCRRIELPTSSN